MFLVSLLLFFFPVTLVFFHSKKDLWRTCDLSRVYSCLSSAYPLVILIRIRLLVGEQVKGFFFFLSVLYLYFGLSSCPWLERLGFFPVRWMPNHILKLSAAGPSLYADGLSNLVRMVNGIIRGKQTFDLSTYHSWWQDTSCWCLHLRGHCRHWTHSTEFWFASLKKEHQTIPVKLYLYWQLTKYFNCLIFIGEICVSCHS